MACRGHQIASHLHSHTSSTVYQANMCMWGRAAGAALPLFLLAVSGAYGQLTNNGEQAWQ